MSDTSQTQPSTYQPRCLLQYNANFPGYTFFTIMVDVQNNQMNLLTLPTDFNQPILNISFADVFMPDPINPTTICFAFAVKSSECAQFTQVQITSGAGEVKHGTVNRPIGNIDDTPPISTPPVDYYCWPIVVISATNSSSIFSGGIINMPTGSSITQLICDIPDVVIQATLQEGLGDGTKYPYYGMRDGVALPNSQYNSISVVTDIVARQFPIGYFINSSSIPPVNLYTDGSAIIL